MWVRRLEVIASVVRRTAFWDIDYLKGKPIGKHYKDIKEIIENKNNEALRVDTYLEELLKYATSTVDFYKPYSSYSTLNDFPIINKLVIKEQPKSFISPIYQNSKLHYRRTSGSTGMPFVFIQDMNKRNRVLASLIYFGQNCGFELGDKNIYIGVWSEQEKKSKWASYKQNMITVDIKKLGDDELEKIRQLLKQDKKIKTLFSYASTLDRFAKYLLNNGDSPGMFSIKTIISGAEKLQETTRNNLKKVFGCDVVSRYSNNENGVLAQECISELEFHMNNADFFFEVLKLDSDKPAGIGETGRIVVTDLFNYAMPLIRYDTGDIGVISSNTKCSLKGPAFSRIDGRNADLIYDTHGKPLNPNWDFDIDNFDKIKQYQFIQEDEKIYRLIINCEKGIYPDSVFVIRLKHTLGEDAEIKIEYVDDIPLLSSGKFRQNINNYIKEHK